jgi:AraC-like DNA-binding protein
VSLSYGAPVKINAGNFPRLFLMMHCDAGTASTAQGNLSAQWRRGQTMPLSADVDTKLWFDQDFMQRSIRLNLDKLEAQCTRWLGRGLEQPLRFALHPFSPDLEALWQCTLNYLWSIGSGRLCLSPVSKAALDDYLLTLLLHQHPHNYSAALENDEPVPVPGLVRRAERFIEEHAAGPITVSDVADHLGVSLRSLQSGFQQWRNTTPNAFLRTARLRLVREALSQPRDDTTVTIAATNCGFSHLGRFSTQYKSAFGEDPSTTLRRGRRDRERIQRPMDCHRI